MKHHMFTFSLVIAMALTISAFSQHGSGHESGGKMMKMLDLTEEQQANIQELRLAHKKEVLPLKAKLKTLESNLKLEMTAESFDEAQARKIVEEMGTLRMEMHMNRLLHKQDVRNMLTPEQRQKFDLHLLSAKGRGRGHGGPPSHGSRGRGMRQGHRQ